jgi:hypothetical protein
VWRVLIVNISGYLKCNVTSDGMKYLLLPLLLLLFPHRILIDGYSVILLLASYIFLVFIMRRLKDFSQPEIMLYLIVAFGCSALHILRNGEVMEWGLRACMERTAPGPWRFRILFPEIVNGISRICPADVVAFHLAARVVSIVLTFVLTYRVLRKHVGLDHRSAFLLPFLYLLATPFSWDYLYITDFPEVLFSCAMMAAVLSGRRWVAALVFLVGLLNRDTMVFGLVFYLIYTIYPAKLRLGEMFRSMTREWKTLLLLVGLGIAAILLKWAVIKGYGAARLTENKWDGNLANVNMYLQCLAGHVPGIPGDSPVSRFMAFSGGLYIVVALYVTRINGRFIAGFCGATIFLLTCTLEYANLDETRVLFPTLPYLLFCLATILKSGWEGSAPAYVGGGRVVVYGIVLPVVIAVTWHGFIMHSVWCR